MDKASTRASVTLIEGQMGEGKTITATAIAVDASRVTNGKTKIFANYHLYGLKYIYCDVVLMLRYLNSGLISNGIMIIDEAYIAGDARRGMNSLAVLFTQFGQQMRKRQIELYILVQHGRFIDWRFRYIMSRKILCKYNAKSRMVTLMIKDMRKNTERQVSYWAPQYFKYFDTNELPPIPEKMIAKAAEWA